MTQARVRQGFEVALKAWADALTPALPIAWENLPFTAPAGRYARAFVLPAETESLFLDMTGREYLGILQVNFVMVAGAGAGGAEALAASLDSAFTGTLLSGGLRIWLIKPFGARNPMEEDGRWVVPCSATYKAVSP